MPADLTLDGRAEPSALARARAWIASRHWSFLVGAILFALILGLVIFAPWISGQDPARQALLQRLKPPSAEHWLGTDGLGRDLFARILYGGRFTIAIAAITVLLTVVIGTLVGVLSARRGGFADDLTMRVVDLLLSIPDAIIAIFLVAAIGPGIATLVIALTLVGWTPYARLARGLTLEVNSRDYIRAAEVLGLSRATIVWRHIIPNAIGPISSVSFLRFGHKLITVGGLSFLGLGVQPPGSDWGMMLADAQPHLERAPMLMIAPGLAIFLTALSVTWIGQGLEIARRR